MITAQPSALSGQLSADKAMSYAKQANKGRSVPCMIIDELQESAFADSLVLRAESFKK
jgi:hypothetical protein